MSNRFKTQDDRDKRKIRNQSKNTKASTTRSNDETVNIIDDVLRSKNIKVTGAQRDLMIQIFKFIVVGGIATIIDWIIYFVLYHFIKMPPLVANIISFSVSVVYNYWASCKYVFKVNKDKSKVRQFVEFIIFAIIGLGINELMIWGLNSKLGLNAMLVKILATAVVMVFNFVTRKKFLEK